jgi:hypothetical protein
MKHASLTFAAPLPLHDYDVDPAAAGVVERKSKRGRRGALGK